jgi:hypothetical protein
MNKNTEKTPILVRPADAMRQYIDAVSTFQAYEEAVAEAEQVRGGMYWHKGPPSAPEQIFLVRTSSTGSERSLGAKTPENEQIYKKFIERKDLARERVNGLREALKKHNRMNRALRVGRVAPLVVEILNRMAETKLAEHFRVVGTHALYAYESVAGVSFNDEVVATRDIDLLWDVRKRVAFATVLSNVDSSMIGVLKKVDKTFRIRDSQKYTAVNKDGFEVDIIRREQVQDDPHPVKLSDEDEDFWVTQAPRAQELLDSPQFSAVIVASNGEMARMNTLDPMTFVRFKKWMGKLPDRDPLKRRRDLLQAKAVEIVVPEYLPQWAKD